MEPGTAAAMLTQAAACLGRGVAVSLAGRQGPGGGDFDVEGPLAAAWQQHFESGARAGQALRCFGERDDDVSPDAVQALIAQRHRAIADLRLRDRASLASALAAHLEHVAKIRCVQQLQRNLRGGIAVVGE